MITGAGRGLGRAFAEEAVKNGDQVIATVRKLSGSDELMKNENVLPVIMDVTNKDEVKAAVQAGIALVNWLQNSQSSTMMCYLAKYGQERKSFLRETAV